MPQFDALQDFGHWVVFGNSLMSWALALAITAAVLVAVRIVQRVLVRRLQALSERTKNEIDDLGVNLIHQTRSFFVAAVAAWAGSLALNQQVQEPVRDVLIIAALVQVALWGNALITFSINRYVKRVIGQDAVTATTITALGVISRVAVWIVVLLLAISNVTNFDISTLLAGLGVGGIAIGLAVQNILSDLFASLSIVLDKPFVIGDFIIVDNMLGTVEHIGLKSTRVRSLSGEQIIFSNADLLGSRIRNYKRMEERRIAFTIGVTYQTPYEKLVKIPAMIKEIIEAQDRTRFDRAHFKEYGNFSLNFEIVYYVTDPDYNLYMDIQQAINLELFQRFSAEGIEFAYLTQTLFLERNAD